MLTLFKEKIEGLGGVWKRLEIEEGKSVFAIIPPEESSEEWELLEKDLLGFKWDKRRMIIKEGEEIEVIVTCEDPT